jgi:hypothetical protein
MPDSPLRTAVVGSLLTPAVLDRPTARVLDATVIFLPGAGETDAYLAALDSHAEDFAAWDGRFMSAEPDGHTAHRVLIVDRYGQVYAVHEADDAAELPDPEAVTEWFRFLATACPECGVIDDPLLAGPTL